MTEIKTVKSFFDVLDQSAVLASLYRLYEGQEKNDKGYKMAWETIVSLSPIESGLSCSVTRGGDVSGIEPGKKIGYALEFTRWEEWLSMPVISELPDNETLAHILYEMTFCGYSQKPIQEKWEDIVERFEELENGTAKTIPLRDVLRNHGLLD